MEWNKQETIIQLARLSSIMQHWGIPAQLFEQPVFTDLYVVFVLKEKNSEEAVCSADKKTTTLFAIFPSWESHSTLCFPSAMIYSKQCCFCTAANARTSSPRRLIGYGFPSFKFTRHFYSRRVRRQRWQVLTHINELKATGRMEGWKRERAIKVRWGGPRPAHVLRPAPTEKMAWGGPYRRAYVWVCVFPYLMPFDWLWKAVGTPLQVIFIITGANLAGKHREFIDRTLWLQTKKSNTKA